MPTWSSSLHPLPNGAGTHVTLQSDGQALTVEHILGLWRENPEFRSFFSSLLATSSVSAFRWETPPIILATLRRPFEFVLLPQPALDRPPEPEAFFEQFRLMDPGQSVLAFPNLGRDAILIVPRPRVDPAHYVHLASLIRHAPDSQKHALWETIAATVQSRLSRKPLWLSTAGMGVAWLHVRLDSRPKYYGHAPYRVAP